MHPNIDAILSDTRKLRTLLEQTNRFGPFEQQIMSQLFALNANEETLTNWLTNVEAPLTVFRDAQIADQARIAELEAELAALKTARATVPVPSAPEEVIDVVGRPVDDITGYKRPSPIREDMENNAAG